LSRRKNTFVLAVEDGGPGFDLQTVHPRLSGLQLVQGLVRQLRGKLTVEKSPSRCTIQFA
jgi:two-component sensor histidine kinase